MNRPVEFGLYLRMYDDYLSILNLAHEAERQGFPIGYLNDHLLFTQDDQKNFLENWTVLTAIGSQTTDLRLSHIVLCNSFRNPALLAKMATTLDIITNGRFELGIGAGWHAREYQAFGYEFPKPSVRIEQLSETLQIIKKLFTEPETTFNGKYYTLDRCINLPKPVQKPHPPIMVGGEGDRLLKVAAEFADEINIPSPSLEKVRDRIRFVCNYCETIGRDPQELRFSIFTQMVLLRDENELEPILEKVRPKIQSREDFLASALVGTPETILDQIHEYIELGVSRFALIVYDPIPERLQIVSKMAKNQFT